MVSVSDTPELLVPDAAAWRVWLAEHHDSTPTGVRLVIAKKGTTEPTSLAIADALDEALCFGWIDGQRNARDEATFSQRFSPRRSTSTWSARNVAYVARLVEEGRMTPAGQAEIDRAKADGRWDRAYQGSKDSVVPPDLQAALDASPAASAMFATINRSNRFAIIFRTEQAKRADTRANRIAKFVAMLERGETLH
jgi:uncharacterized protein YdeI (YjbR/CyaY-like superfamily)